jgi:hypothetical protein
MIRPAPNPPPSQRPREIYPHRPCSSAAEIERQKILDLIESEIKRLYPVLDRLFPIRSQTQEAFRVAAFIVALERVAAKIEAREHQK